MTYNCLIEMYAKGGLPWEAVQVLKQLSRKRGIKPDVVSYDTVINGFCRQRLMKEALGFTSPAICVMAGPVIVPMVDGTH
jgi:pentatricopeptide repeat domain-containing protein 1